MMQYPHQCFHTDDQSNKTLVIFPKQQVLHSSKLKEFSDKNFKVDGNSKRFTKRVENIVGKGEMWEEEKLLIML